MKIKLTTIYVDNMDKALRFYTDTLGFQKKANAYRHPRTHFILEFPKGPLGVGDDLIQSWSTVRRSRKVLECPPITFVTAHSSSRHALTLV